MEQEQILAEKDEAIQRIESSLREQGKSNLALEGSLHDLQNIIRQQPLTRAHADQLIEETKNHKADADVYRLQINQLDSQILAQEQNLDNLLR